MRSARNKHRLGIVRLLDYTCIVSTSKDKRQRLLVPYTHNCTLLVYPLRSFLYSVFVYLRNIILKCMWIFDLFTAFTNKKRLMQDASVEHLNRHFSKLQYMDIHNMVTSINIATMSDCKYAFCKKTLYCLRQLQLCMSIGRTSETAREICIYHIYINITKLEWLTTSLWICCMFQAQYTYSHRTLVQFE